MKSYKKNITYLLLISLALLSACNKELELNIEEPDDLIVVDAWIEHGNQAKVFLTRNTPYFTTIDSSSLRNLVLTRAKLTLNDGEDTEVLILRKDLRYFPPYYYEGNTIFGDTGKIYTLRAEYGGKTIISETTIPPKVEIDTVYFVLNDEDEQQGHLELEFTDPIEEKNYYRIFTQVLGKDEKFISSFIIAIDDQYFNGEKVSYSISRAPESFLSNEEVEYFRSTDTILIKLHTMDRSSFNFWSTYQEEVINATNPFASSMINIESNIYGDGLGIWAGYGVVVDTVFPSINKKSSW